VGECVSCSDGVVRGVAETMDWASACGRALGSVREEPGAVTATTMPPARTTAAERATAR
jgi:hypothetical protein